jgi:hypothetical protein
VRGCFAGLPDFSATAASLAALGWHTGPGASATEAEARKETVNVFINTGDSFNSPGCTVMSGDVPVSAAQALLERQLDRDFAEGGERHRATAGRNRGWCPDRVLPL